MAALQERRKTFTVEDQRASVRLALNVVKLPPAGAASTGNSVAGAWGTASPNKSAGFKVNNVVWSVGGPETPLRQALAEAIDKAWLQGLLGKPLPTTDASQAVAVKAAAAAPTPLATAQPDTTTDPAPPAVKRPAAQAPTPAPAPTADTAKKADDTLNKLRGLLGR